MQRRGIVLSPEAGRVDENLPRMHAHKPCAGVHNAAKPYKPAVARMVLHPKSQVTDTDEIANERLKSITMLLGFG